MFNLKYRPQKLTELIGNEDQIRNLLNSYPDWPHSWLIVGPPGVGKTTLGRAIANQLGCKDLNITEIDAGQDRGIDKVREIIRGTYARPLIGKNKVYIFDECQGLTAEAQQALLKVTEEPPKNTYFIFCSTNPNKIIKALKARCQYGSVNLNTLNRKELGLILKNVCEKEEIKLEGIVKEIAILCINNADGIPRDALMLFEKFYKNDNIKEIAKQLINVEEHIAEEIWDIVNALDKKDMSLFLELFEKMNRGNFESFRITFGNIFKKKLLRAMKEGNKERISKYNGIMTMFSKPVDNTLGDIELIQRFGNYMEVYE